MRSKREVRRDPVCGMKVDPARAASAEHCGVTYHFCSSHCQRQFVTDPGAYLGAAGGEGSHGEPRSR